MQRLANSWLLGQLQGVNHWLPVQRQACAGFAGKAQGGDGEKKEIDRGSRFAAHLTPQQVQRMKNILGAHELDDQSQPSPVHSVTLSLLQTIKHLDAPDDLKRRLMAYKVLSLNRELEGVHRASQQLVASMAGAAQPQERPSGGLGLLKQFSKGLSKQ